MPKLRCLVLAIGGLSAWLLAAAPSHGHAGGKVQLYPKSFDVEPATDGYHAKVVLVDQDSGAPQTGFSVTVSGSGGDGSRFEPVTLTPLADGRYEGLIAALTPGRWTLALRAQAVPGTDDAVPLERTVQMTLEDPAAHRAASSVGSEGEGSGDGGTNIAIPLAGVALAGALAYGVRRRRGPVATAP